MECTDMDIERFAANAGTVIPAVIKTLPATVELTGFSDRRHYLEQQALFGHSGRRHHTNDEPWVSPLDSQH